MMLAAAPLLSLDVLRILAAETRSARIAIVEAKHRGRGMSRRQAQARRHSPKPLSE
jgi:hypothetical protein